MHQAPTVAKYRQLLHVRNNRAWDENIYIHFKMHLRHILVIA